MNRGSTTAPQGHDHRHAGFNEAPIHESGKYPIFGPGTIRLLCFNEAPIHESGKYDRCDGREQFDRRFNEAPIHESGKYSRCGCPLGARGRLQ